MRNCWLMAKRPGSFTPASWRMKTPGPSERTANGNGAGETVATMQTKDSVTTVQGCPAEAHHDREVPKIDLLSPLTVHGFTLRNRIVMSPMCHARP
jgi:hypothetical protein